MFLLMNSLRDEAVVNRILRLELKQADVEIGSSKGTARQLAEGTFGQGADPAPQLQPQAYRPLPTAPPPPEPRLPAPGAEARAVAAEHGLRRNDPCPCGSGKKFKKCCYLDDGQPDGSEATL